MCGRFALFAQANEIAQEFGVPVKEVAHVAPRYNIAPSQPVLAIRVAPDGSRHATHFAWGLVPSWANDPSVGSRMINVRAETAAEKPAFRAAFRRRRCIIPASGFFEWATTGTGKIPYFFRPRSGCLFGFAGLWELWNGPNGELIETCAIITVPAQGAVLRFHERMPAILGRPQYAPWLDPRLEDVGVLRSLLLPPSPPPIESYRVSPLVNQPRNDLPACIEPVGS
ncbi:MAG: SOS response-associated peptidase [Candidatus Sumerlaeaceae bacterium]|nr:SOS response-associated peptidase [Candidatus Sumerlaeaceae bacterium]